MIDRIAKLVVTHPWRVIVAFVLFAVAIGSRLPTAEVDPEVKHMLPQDFPARIDLDRIEELFGGVDLLMVTVVDEQDVLAPATLERIEQLSRRIEKIDGVDRVLSLFELKDIRNDGQTMVVDPAVKHIPRTRRERETLRADLKNNDLVYGSVVSSDFKASAIVALLTVKAEDGEVIAAFQRAIEQTPGRGSVHLAGFPLVRKLVGEGIRGDMRRFLPLGMLVMLIFLFVSFRQLRGMLLPFVVVLLSVMVTMGLVPLFGWKIQMLTIILPVILLAIANDYGIHLIARYQEINAPDSRLEISPAPSPARAALSPRQLAHDVLTELARPIAITGLTTMAGLMCLMLHLIVPAKQMGVLATLGILYAVLASLLLIPAVLALLPRAKPVVTAAAGSGKMSLLDRLLAQLARAVSARPKAIIGGLLASALLVGFGIWRLEIDTNTVNYFAEDHPIAVASRIADEHFGGSTTFGVAIAGDIKHPEVLRRLDALAQRLEQLPQVDQTTSIAKVIRQMNEVMHDDDPAYDRIPETREAVAQLLLMYENGGEPEDFDRLVDFGYRNALLTARINSQSTKVQSQVIRLVRRYVAAHNARWADEQPPGEAQRPGDAQRPGAMQRPKRTTDAEPEESPFTLVDGEGSDASPERREPAGSPFTLVDETPDAGRPGEARVVTPPVADGFAVSRFTLLGGFAVLFNDLVDAVVFGQLSSLGLSLLLVVLIVALLFRSLVAGLLCGGTLALAMATLFGLMGLLGIELNLPTAMLSSIMIGVGVDYTIHFLWRYRRERRGGQQPAVAVVRTLTTSGRGIIINALSVIFGFAVMFVSNFMPVRYFGFLVVVSITACLIGAMVLMPALVVVFRPRFLEPIPGGER